MGAIRTVRRGFTPEERLWMQCDKSGGEDSCWNWVGCSRGIAVNGRAETPCRMAWTFTFGPIDKGMYVEKKCNNADCINPKHLQLTSKGGRKPRPIADRFWEKVNKRPNGCWLFTSNHGGGGPDGYGQLSVPDGEEYMAHRVSWVIHNGPIPGGLLVLHKCDVPRCVNPGHLFLGTHQDNVDDMIAKGRGVHGTTGAINPLTKLTESQVLSIRKQYNTGRFSQQQIAELYSVNQTLISAIVTRKIWKHI